MSLAPNLISNADCVEPPPPPKSKRGDWTWEMVAMFPRQGEWTEEDYLRREFDGRVEFVDGVLEFLPVTSFSHQDLVIYLFERLNQCIGRRVPREVYVAPVQIRTRRGSYREPDVAYIQTFRVKDRSKPADGADLVMEVVSADSSDRNRDYHEKRVDYAETGIPEYWIVDPQLKLITVLVLDGKEYRIHGEFQLGSMATSVLLPGFEVNVTEAFDSAHS